MPNSMLLSFRKMNIRRNKSRMILYGSISPFRGDDFWWRPAHSLAISALATSALFAEVERCLHANVIDWPETERPEADADRNLKDSQC
jgi:hypothetical protein